MLDCLTSLNDIITAVSRYLFFILLNFTVVFSWFAHAEDNSNCCVCNIFWELSRMGDI